MQIFIGCAKTMVENTLVMEGCTIPAFQDNANAIAMQMATYSPDELKDMLRCNAVIAKENWRRYQAFFEKTKLHPALFCYDGMVFQKIDAATLSESDLEYANSHLLIGSFLYGLLRPLDLIKPYRLEGNVTLPCTGHEPIFDYWKPILTEWLIEKVKNDDGVLVNLASKEFKDIFNWKRVKEEVKVITPDFKVEKDGRLRTIVIYAKMCRGAMTRWILENRISDTSELAAFEYEGFKWDSDYNFNLR